MKMLHDDKEKFLKVLESTSAKTGFPLRLLEKDYYLTIVLSRINEGLSSNLIFKGGTCLNKIYYSYYRLSEDLDFSLKLPSDNMTRPMRRKAINPIKKALTGFAKSFGLSVKTIDGAGRNESTQYIFYLNYHSIILNKQDSIELEIGLRFNPILPVESCAIKHKFLHPFTGELLFDAGTINCLALKELVAEKMRAAATRLDVAPRDFYDLGFLLKKGFDFRDKEFLALFKKKLAEDGFSTNLSKYRHNLGRSDEEISGMLLRLKDELFPVLTVGEQERFNLKQVLGTLNDKF